jgi:uncharacterized protein YqjF (DUF2071 family)
VTDDRDDDGERYDGQAPAPIERPVMGQAWEHVTFLHWPFEPAVVQRLLPPGLEVHTFDDRAWVALVPLYIRVRTPGGLEVPWAARFCETNVRTYVRDRAGRSGIWFLSLDAARLGVVLTARAAYGLPYFWSRLRIVHEGDELAYTCARRWPGPRGARSVVRVRTGAPFAPAELRPFDHFLTAKWRLFSVWFGRPRMADATHEPWPLRRADVLELDDELVAASGLPSPQGDPIVHHSAGVHDVRISRPLPAASAG